MDVKMKRTQLNLFKIFCGVLCFILFLKTTTTKKISANELKQKTATYLFATSNAEFKQPHSSFQQHEKRLQPFKALLTTVDRIPLATDPRSERFAVLKQNNAVKRGKRLVRDISENNTPLDENLKRSTRQADEPEAEGERSVGKWISDNLGQLVDLVTRLAFATLSTKFQQPHNSFKHHEQRLQPFKALLTTVDRIPLTTDPRSERLAVLKQTNAINRHMRPMRAIRDNDDVNDSNKCGNDNSEDGKASELPQTSSSKRTTRDAEKTEKESEGGVVQWIGDNIGQIMGLVTRIAVIILNLFL